MKAISITAMIFAVATVVAGDFDFIHTSPGELIRHKHFAFSYSEEHELALWVAYELTAEELQGHEERTDNYRSDPAIRTDTAANSDYKRSGYDRGHLAPAADMRFSAQAMSESFYHSNLTPQAPAFNRGIWLYLEKHVRIWAKEYGSVYVATGPIIEPARGTIGSNSVTVPWGYYKAVMRKDGDTWRVVALALPNERGSKPLGAHAVTVDDLEERTGIDFFPALPDDIEDRIESRVDDSWPFKVGKRFASAGTQGTKDKAPQTAELTHWLTKSSKKRHNSSCRYFRQSNGRPCGANTGIACKSCGG